MMCLDLEANLPISSNSIRSKMTQSQLPQIPGLLCVILPLRILAAEPMSEGRCDQRQEPIEWCDICQPNQIK
jgi:hypothetical protein